MYSKDFSKLNKNPKLGLDQIYPDKIIYIQNTVRRLSFVVRDVIKSILKVILYIRLYK